MPESKPPEGLYGAPSAPLTAAPEAPGLLEQFTGLFTEPVALFRKLSVTPAWGWALGATLAAALAMTLVWAARVDPDAMLRPILESRLPNASPDQIEKMVAIQGRFLGPIGAIQVLVFIPLMTALMAFFYWLIGKGTAEGAPPSYRHAYCATVVPGLSALPKLFLMALICVLKPIGGVTPEKLSPTSLGYYLSVDSVKLHALFYSLDLFTILGLTLLYLAARHILRLRPVGAGACVALGALVQVGLQVLGAR